MKIVVVHNRYRQPGGEDVVFAAETALLEEKGHDVVRYQVDNQDLDPSPPWRLAARTVWNSESFRSLSELFSTERPDVVHVHNTLPIISPAVYYAAGRERAAVVQTLHNYRLVCPSGLLFRKGKPCNLCVGKAVAFPGILYACYRSSRSATSAVTAMLAYHRARGTYRTRVDRYIALTGFAREMFVAGGIPPERIAVKPNFVREDPGIGGGDGGYALFVGRLSEEKGISVLLDAWKRVGSRMHLRIAGDGPLMPLVRRAASETSGITVMGRIPRRDVLCEMKRARIVLIPSLSYEQFPMTAVEALAVGTPLVASRLGSMAAIVAHGETGLHFEPGDPGDLASTILSIADQPEKVNRMRPRARREYQEKYSAEANYERLMAIYAEAVEERALRDNRDG